MVRSTLVATLVCVACTASLPTPNDDGDSVRAATIDDLAPRKLQRGKVIGGERAKRTITWPAEAERDVLAESRYAADVHATLARPRIPVIAPAEPTTNVVATSGDTWYALSVHGKGYVLHTTGSSQARVHPHIRTTEPTHPMRKDGGFLTRNEDIWAASWIENGAAYSFEIECDRRVVQWCDDEAVVLQHVESLVHMKAGAR
jgi:hypothetical protein